MGFFDKIKKALMGKEEPEQSPVVPEEIPAEETDETAAGEQQKTTAATTETPQEDTSEQEPAADTRETKAHRPVAPAATAATSFQEEARQPEDLADEQLTSITSESTAETAAETGAGNTSAAQVLPEVQDDDSPTAAEGTGLDSLQPLEESPAAAEEATAQVQPVAETEDSWRSDFKTVEVPEAAVEPNHNQSAADAAPTAESLMREAESAQPAAPIDPQPQPTVEEKYDKGLKKSRKTFGQRLNELFANFRSVDEDFFEEVEETLIGADVGFDAAMQIADEMRQEVKLQNVKKPKDVQNVIIEKLVNLYDEAGEGENHALNLQPNGPTVMLFVGVNGVGKTTSIGKLAYEYRMAGKKVLMAAADTFRAGAIDQLVVWGERAGVEVVRHKAGGDPAAVVFDAVQKAKDEHYDILLVDTAGRLQNKVNLMKELDKIKRVIQRELPEAPHEVLLVVDATTGQNAMVQAKQFKETTDVSGIVLTKLDGTAKGGIVLAIRNELHLPVKLVGLGEGIDDLEPFDPNQFVIGLFKGLIQE